MISKINELVSFISLFFVCLASISKEFQGVHQMVVLNLTAQPRGCEQSPSLGGLLHTAPQAVQSDLTGVFIFKYSCLLFLHFCSLLRASSEERGN